MKGKAAFSIILLFLIILLIVASFYMGYRYRTIELKDKYKAAIDFCQERQQVLRIYEDRESGPLITECFGELPLIDVHIKFEERN